MTISTLGYALLGLLAREPQSGYQLAKHLKRPIGCFWSAGHSQIYPELGRLHTAGLVSFEPVQQQERPNKKVYSLTSAGRSALASWVVEDSLPTAGRSDLLLKAYSVWLADAAAAARLFRREQQRHLDQLAEYQRIGAALGSIDGVRTRWSVADPNFAAYATLRRGLAHEHEEAEWCGWLADTLDAAGSAPT